MNVNKEDVRWSRSTQTEKDSVIASDTIWVATIWDRVPGHAGQRKYQGQGHVLSSLGFATIYALNWRYIRLQPGLPTNALVSKAHS